MFFVSGFVVLCRFFTILLVLGSLFEKVSRKNSLHVRSCFFPATILSHSVWSVFPLLEGGNAVRFFHFLFFVAGSVSFVDFFAVLLFLGSLFEKIFGSELLFLGVGVGRVFFGAVLPMFFLYCLVFRSRKCLENIFLMSGLLFLVFFSLPLVFSSTSRFFVFFKRESSGSNRAHPHTHLGCFFLFLFLSRRTCLFALFGRASRFLRFCRGAILGPARFWDSPGTYGA